MDAFWEPDEIAIFEYFHNKCLHCGRKGIVIHELVPKSRTKDWKRPGNRVILCLMCHGWAHRIGTRNSRKILLEDLEKWQSHNTSTQKTQDLKLIP